MERVLGEHQLFSEGLGRLQLWVMEAHRTLTHTHTHTHLTHTHTHTHLTHRTLQHGSTPPADKNLLLHWMSQLEELVAARAGKEIELKMLITRGECVQRNTSAEGVPVLRKQMQDLKDAWDSLLATCISCKSGLEGALVQWTSCQEDEGMFSSWLDGVETRVAQSGRQHPEMRDKTGNLGRAKILYEEVLSHCGPLDAIASKASRLSESSSSQPEVQRLMERYTTAKHRAKCAVERAEEEVLAHQEYQRGLHLFEDWLEQQQERLGLLLLNTPAGELAVLENTLKSLQELRCLCSEGPVLLRAVLSSRERVVVSWGGVPQIEDRALEATQREWEGYQARLGEARVRVDGAATRLRQMDLRFRSLEEWLEEMDATATVRHHRRSDRHTKERQLQQLQRCQAEALRYQSEVDGLSVLVQEVLEDTHTHASSQLSNRITQLCGRYHTLLLKLMETITQIQEEICSIDDAHSTSGTFSDWLTTAQREFVAITSANEDLDIVAMEKRLKSLEALQNEAQRGHGLMKSLREQAEGAAAFLDACGAERLEVEVEGRLAQLEELAVGLRAERGTLDRNLKLHREFQGRRRALAQWLQETRLLLGGAVEPKAELYQRQAQLAKYQAVQQELQCRGRGLQAVVERGRSLQSSAITESLETLQDDYTDLCTTATLHTQRAEAQVREQEDYLRELQEVELWLLQTCSSMVTPDPSEGRSLEAATQQLAGHKAIMEEIAGFEERLEGLKQRGESLVSACVGSGERQRGESLVGGCVGSAERQQTRLRGQVQSHLQGARDSYSAICSTAQRVYQCLDCELQRHASVEDALPQCHSWLSAVQAELQSAVPTPLSLQEALSQVKQDKALQEQVGTYLQLLCSSCDLSDEAVRETATEIQHVRVQVEARLRGATRAADQWRELGEQQDRLNSRLSETERRLHSLSRRPAQLEPRGAQDLLDQNQAFIQDLEQQQAELSRLGEALASMAGIREAPPGLERGEVVVRHLRQVVLDLGQLARDLIRQRQEDLERGAEYHHCGDALDRLFQQVSREWDYLARADTESTSEHLGALKKLFADLQDQEGLLEDLRESRLAILPRLSPEDRDLVKEHVAHLEHRWVRLENLIRQKIRDSASVLKDLELVEARLREAREWAQEEKQPSLADDALRTSPPPPPPSDIIGQSFLFDHLSACAEMEAKQLLLTQAVGDADELCPRLGLSERRRLRALTQQAQAEVEALGVTVTQRRRKHLTEALAERTQFRQALGRAAAWVRQREGKALAEAEAEHVALLPDDVSRQVDGCRGALSSLKAYQEELTSLWTQARDLVKDSTDQEKDETLGAMQEVQGTFDSALRRGTRKLLDLEKALATRKYFKVDLDKMCDWLKRKEALMFGQIDWSVSDSELQLIAAQYQDILEQASEYENLLLIVQRAGQEILPTLNEVDHCYLDEKLNALPQQYNSILVSATQRHESVQQAVSDRRTFGSLMEAAHETTRELQEQFEALEKQSPSCSMDDSIPRLHSHLTDLQRSLGTQDASLKDLRRRNEALLCAGGGQPCKTEALHRLLRLHSGLKHKVKVKLKDLDRVLTSAEQHNMLAAGLESELKAPRSVSGGRRVSSAETAEWPRLLRPPG
ncbi:nesprin-1-like [Clupea harengus]|uniref:Nesprin-1-like n=1 Tax=Clupea harengus TaxID=7950 RepID=A0A6P8GCX4_CLUHA|nr:nesprin-1-like [Clupea harengus]